LSYLELFWDGSAQLFFDSSFGDREFWAGISRVAENDNLIVMTGHHFGDHNLVLPS